MLVKIGMIFHKYMEVAVDGTVMIMVAKIVVQSFIQYVRHVKTGAEDHQPILRISFNLRLLEAVKIIYPLMCKMEIKPLPDIVVMDMLQ